MPHLRSVALKGGAEEETAFPFSVPVVQALADAPLTFPTPVTIFVGENGTGKSTVLEGIACAAGSIVAGSNDLETDASLAAGRALSNQLRLTWSKRTHRGFFLRAEDFFGYARRMTSMQDELTTDLAAIENDAELSDVAKGFARMPYAGQLRQVKDAYGDGLDARSHGEAFLSFFAQRLVPRGLYLLDEPETPLSPMRQLSLLSLIKRMVADESQFVIATHSPLLMAFPGATIYGFDGGQIESLRFDEVEHVSVTRSFLDDPEAFLRHL